MKIDRVWLKGGVVFVLMATILFLVLIFYQKRPLWEFEKQLAKMKTEEQVKKMLGNSNHLFRHNNKNIYIDYYDCPIREITDHVLVFFPKIPNSDTVDVILYVYIDEKSNVEAYDICGT